MISSTFIVNFYNVSLNMNRLDLDLHHITNIISLLNSIQHGRVKRKVALKIIFSIVCVA